MDIILTSFGLSHLDNTNKSSDRFYRMPPAALSTLGRGFIPDYAVLLLCDRIILDEETFSRFKEEDEDTYSGYHDVAKTLLTLYDEGFVKLENFDAIIDNNRDYLDAMLQDDLNNIDTWIAPLQESHQSWLEFVRTMQGHIFNDYVSSRDKYISEEDENLQKRLSEQHIHLYLHLSKNRWINASDNIQLYELSGNSQHNNTTNRFHEGLRHILAEYISYVNANLLLSKSLNAGFHDWFDFAPFYARRFKLRDEDQAIGQARIQKIKQLFSVTFPDISMWDEKKLIKALRDNRLHDLRLLVDQAVRDKEDFDQKFANNVLREVLRIEYKVKRKRKIISYATLPIDFIPWVGGIVQKGAEELLGHVVEEKDKEELGWFYLISDLSDYFNPSKSK